MRSHLAARGKSAAQSIACTLALLALVILADHYVRHHSGRADQLAIGAQSALMLFLLSASLWVRCSMWRWARAVSVLLALGAAAASIGMCVFAMAGASPQRSTAIALLGISLATLDWEPRRGVRPAQWLTLASLALSLAVVVGYLYDAPALYRIAPYDGISIYEALMLGLLSMAVPFASPDMSVVRTVTSETAGGVLARVLPLAAAAVPASFGWLALKGQWMHYYGASMGMSLFVLANTSFFSLLIFRTARSLVQADERRTQAEEMLRLRARQRAGVAQLGQRALSGASLHALVEASVRLVADGLPLAWGEFIEHQDDVPLTCSSTDAPAEHQNTVTVYGFGLAAPRDVVINDVPNDTRIYDPDLVARGVVSAALVSIRSASRPYGVLAAYSPKTHAFSDEDLQWLQTVAGVLTSARERQSHEDALRLSEEKFAGLFRSSPDGIIVASQSDGSIVEVNQGLLEMTGLERVEVLGRTIADLQVWPESFALGSHDTRAGGRNLEVPFRSRSGEDRIGLASIQLTTIGDQPYRIIVIRDVSDQKRAQAGVQQANDRLTQWVGELEARSREITLLNEMGDLLQTCLTSAEASQIAVQFARQLLPDSCGAISTFAEGAKRLQALATWGSIPAEETTFAPSECWGVRRGRPYAVRHDDAGPSCTHVRTTSAYLCVPMMAQGEALGTLHVRACDSSNAGTEAGDWVTETRQRLIVAIAEHVGLALANVSLRERLRDQSIRDQLTGLYNRRYLEESLEMELVRARRSSRPLAIVLIDLDKFKAVNDTYGHDAGDELLRSVSEVFREQLRGGDIVCRYGGEEFLFVLPEIQLHDAVSRAEEIRLAVRGVVVRHRSQSLGHITTSIGLALFPEHGHSANALLRGADEALYRAKAQGGDCIEWSDVAAGAPVQAPRSQ